MGLSHLGGHKFKSCFQNLSNTLRKCGYKIESTVRIYLYCSFLTNERTTRFSTLRNEDIKLFEITDSLLTNVFLFGKESLNVNHNTEILNITIEFIL